MKKIHILCLVITMFAAGCATMPTEPQPPVTPPLPKETGTLDIDVAPLKERTKTLENLLISKELSENDKNTALALLDLYRLLEKVKSGPATQASSDTLIRNLLETTLLMDRNYFEKVAKTSGVQISFSDYMESKNEILNQYLDRNYSNVIQRTLAFQTRFPGGLTPDMGIIFAASLAQDGMLEEAIDIGSEFAQRIERSSDPVKLRSDIARWQLATGQKGQAVKTLEKIADLQSDQLAAIDDLGKQIQETPAPPDQPFRSMFEPPEGTEPPDLEPHLLSLREKVDGLARNHEYKKAKDLLLKEKAVREEGPDTESIDQALKNLDEAETAYEEDLKIKEAYRKKTFDTAKQLFEGEDYKEAISILNMLEKTQGLDSEAADLKSRAVSSLINHERNRAAEIFLKAKKTKDPDKKKELLETAYNILNTLVLDYPSSPLKKKITSNIAIVQKEIAKLP